MSKVTHKATPSLSYNHYNYCAHFMYCLLSKNIRGDHTCLLRKVSDPQYLSKNGSEKAELDNQGRVRGDEWSVFLNTHTVEFVLLKLLKWNTGC